MRDDDMVWECFGHPESYRWGGDPGDQLKTVPAALRSLGDKWLLRHVSLIGCSDVARMEHVDNADEFVLKFDYREGSPTEGAWGFVLNEAGQVGANPEYGFSCPGEAVEAFLRRI